MQTYKTVLRYEIKNERFICSFVKLIKLPFIPSTNIVLNLRSDLVSLGWKVETIEWHQWSNTFICYVSRVSFENWPLDNTKNNDEVIDELKGFMDDEYWILEKGSWGGEDKDSLVQMVRNLPQSYPKWLE